MKISVLATVLVLTMPALGQYQETQPEEAGCAALKQWEAGVEKLPTSVAAPQGVCEFHQWSWATFLWLMGPDGNGEVLASLPYYQQLKGLHPVEARHVKTNTPAAMQDFEESQAMSGALVDQQGQIVYYLKQLNEPHKDTIQQYARTQEMLAENVKDPKAAFPTGSLELKGAWRVAKYHDTGQVLISAPGAYHTADFKVPPVTGVTPDGKVIVSNDESKLRPATLALVGLHIVATTENHPEFLWATFEHIDNAPACAETGADQTATNPVTGEPWSFYPGGVDCRKCKKQPWFISPDNLSDSDNAVCPPCNMEPAGGYKLENGHLSPSTMVCAVNPHGGDAEVTPGSSTAVGQLNASVAHLFKGEKLSAYKLAGTLWTGGGIPVSDEGNSKNTFWGLAKNSSAGKPLTLAGSVALENTTMETYFQGGKNCFSCHSVEGPPKCPKAPPNQNNLALSHLVPYDPPPMAMGGKKMGGTKMGGTKMGGTKMGGMQMEECPLSGMKMMKGHGPIE